MPRFFQSTGAPAHDQEIDELWRLYDALSKRVAALEASLASVVGTSGQDSGYTDSGSSAGQSRAPVAIVAGGARQTGPNDPVRGWSFGGYVAEGDTVYVPAFGELEENLTVNGVMVVQPPACPAAVAGMFDAVPETARLSVPELPE